MHLYKLINPSDSITFFAPDDAIARAVVLMIGRGAYGLCDTDDDDREVQCMLLFQPEDVVAQKFIEWFGKPFPEYVEEHRHGIIDALASVATVSARERFVYQRALEAITDPEERERFKRQCDDRNRSSLNAITEYAWKLARNHAEKLERKERPRAKKAEVKDG